MQENNILDVLDTQEDIPRYSGTNIQLIRGLLLGIVAQLFLWMMYFKFVNIIGTGGFDYGSMDIITINLMDYSYSIGIFTMLAFALMYTGNAFYLHLGNGGNQTYPNVLSCGFLLSACSCISFGMVSSYNYNGTLYYTLLRFPVGMSFYFLSQFLLLVGLVCMIKKRFFIVGILLIAFAFLLLPIT